MTSLPAQTPDRQLGLVIDLDICVGCHACAVNCKEWNSGGHSAPMTDWNAYGGETDSEGQDEGAWGVWFNRINAYEAGDGTASQTVYFTGASYKRSSDGIVLVDADLCIGCKLCSWACPYGAREYDATDKVMKKCTLCVDRIYNDNVPEAERIPACVSTCPVGARHYGDLGDPNSEISLLVAARGGYDLMPEMGYRPTNKYLPPRPRQVAEVVDLNPSPAANDGTTAGAGNNLLAWVDAMLSR
jgi:Fe-S-cluster-containing dehydrogenase component